MWLSWVTLVIMAVPAVLTALGITRWDDRVGARQRALNEQAEAEREAELDYLSACQHLHPDDIAELERWGWKLPVELRPITMRDWLTAMDVVDQIRVLDTLGVPYDMLMCNGKPTRVLPHHPVIDRLRAREDA